MFPTTWLHDGRHEVKAAQFRTFVRYDSKTATGWKGCDSCLPSRFNLMRDVSSARSTKSRMIGAAKRLHNQFQLQAGKAS